MAVHAPIMDLVWNEAQSFGLDPEILFKQVGIDPSVRKDPNARVPRKNLDRLIALVYEKTGEITFGATSVSNIHPSHLGPLGYAWLTSATLEEACERLEKYSRVAIDRLQFSYRSEGEEILVGIHFDEGAEIGPMNYLFGMALFVQLARLNLGQSFTPLKVCMTIPEPNEPEKITSYFRCRSEFGATSNRLVIAQSDWLRKLPRANPELALVHDEIVIKYLARLDNSDIVSQVKSAIFELLGLGNVAAEDVAERLHVTSSTLRRKLDEAGVSYTSVLDDLRREMAMQYIQDKSLSLTEISYLLGFSHPSSLSRSFKLWTGKSPSTARHEALGDQS